VVNKVVKVAFISIQIIIAEATGVDLGTRSITETAMGIHITPPFAEAEDSKYTIQTELAVTVRTTHLGTTIT